MLSGFVPVREWGDGVGLPCRRQVRTARKERARARGREISEREKEREREGKRESESESERERERRTGRGRPSVCLRAYLFVCLPDTHTTAFSRITELLRPAPKGTKKAKN